MHLKPTGAMNYIFNGRQSGFSAARVRVTLQLTVDQSVSQLVSLVVELRLGLMTRFLFLYMKVTVLSTWGALSEESSGLSFVSQSVVEISCQYAQNTLYLQVN
jgi:hypothetical protein